MTGHDEYVRDMITKSPKQQTIDALVAALEFVATSGFFICYDDRGWGTVNDALALARGAK